MRRGQPLSMAALACALLCQAAPAAGATYAYDGQGRLKAVSTDDRKEESYTLDEGGNRAAGKGVNVNKGAPKPNDRSDQQTGSQAFTVHPVTNAPIDTAPDGDALTVVGVTQPQ